jgi:hypothetical protein
MNCQETALINLPPGFPERPFEEWNQLVQRLNDLWELSRELGLQSCFEELLLLKEGQSLIERMASEKPMRITHSIVCVDWCALSEDQNLLLLCSVEVTSPGVQSELRPEKGGMPWVRRIRES